MAYGKTDLSGFDLWKAQNYQNMLSLYNGPIGYNKIYDFDTFLQEMYKASQQKVEVPRTDFLEYGTSPGYPTPTTGSDGWPLYPPPPVTNPPTPGWQPDENTMDPRTLPAWLFEQFPENYSYYDNLSKGLLDESWQLQRQAMQVFNQRQKEMSQLFNSETAALKGTIADRTAKLDAALANAESRQNAGIATMGEGLGVYQKYLDEALGLQSKNLGYVQGEQQRGLGALNEAAGVYQKYLDEALGLQSKNLGYVQGEQQRGLGALNEAVSVYQRYLDDAMRLQNEALSANPLKYQHYIDTGTLPEEVDSTLRTLRDQTIASTRAELDRQKAQANAALKQRMSAMGMVDSEYAAIQNARLAGEVGRAMADTIEKQNAGYLQARLQQPYEMQKAAVSTMQNYNPFIGNVMAGGAQQANLQQNYGTGIIGAANAMGALGNQAVGNTMAGGAQQANLQQNYGTGIIGAANAMGALGNQAVGNTMAGGAQQAQNYQNMGKTQVDAATAMGQLQNNAFSNVVGAANSAYGNIMNAGNQQMQYPAQMFQMATALPGNALNARQGYLDTMLNVWKMVLNNDFSNAQLQAQKDANEGNWWVTT